MRRIVCLFRWATAATVLIGCSLPLQAQLIGDPRSIDEVADAGADDGGDTSQQFIVDGASIEDLIAAAKAAATPQVPQELQDPAFDRYVDLLLLGEAWERLDPALMTDVALQFAEGERVLFRSHKGIKSEELFKLAVKMATDRRDQATLDRLQKHFERSGDKSSSESLAASRKLTGEARAVDPALLIPVDEITPEGYALYRGILGEIKAARYIGNREALQALEGELDKWPGLTDQQKQYLQSIMGQSRAEMADGETPELANHLDRLTEASRNDQGQQIAAGILQIIAGALGGGGTVWPGNPAGAGANSEVEVHDDSGLGGDDSDDVGGTTGEVQGFNRSVARPGRPNPSGNRPFVYQPQIPANFRSRW